MQRSCSLNLISYFEWVAFSPSCDGLFCLSCTLFVNQFPSKNTRITMLYTSPLRDWTSARKRLEHHEGSHKFQSSFDGLHKYTTI